MVTEVDKLTAYTVVMRKIFGAQSVCLVSVCNLLMGRPF